MISRVRRVAGLEFAFDEGLEKYRINRDSAGDETANLMLLSGEYTSVTDSFKKAISQFPERAVYINRRYNEYFSGYLDKIQLAKASVAILDKDLEDIMKATPGLGEHIESVDRVMGNDYKFRFEECMSDNLGYLRQDMPQYTYKTAQELVARLKDENVTLNRVSIPVGILKPTQTDISKEKVRNIVDKGMEDKKFMPLVSKDLHILDGHHHWAGLLEEDDDKIIDAWLINLPMHELLERVDKHSDLEKHLAAKMIVLKAVEDGILEREDVKKWILMDE